MPLPTIPLLDKEYPLYDWSDWQSSRDALVKGTPTSHFAKEAWNAIVDSLSEALEGAGLAWDKTYTTAEGAKITEPYGKLTADKFNSVRHNIDWPAPLGWAWADREDFRGYVGREDFKGYQEYHKEADKVYPEYILELVRKLNFLLEIMRYTAPLLESEAPTLMPAPHKAEGVAGVGAPIKLTREFNLQLQTGVIAGKGLNAVASSHSKVDLMANVIAGFGGNVFVRPTIPLTVDVAGRSVPAALGEVYSLAAAPVMVSGFSNPTVHSDVRELTQLKTQVSAVSNEAIHTSASMPSLVQVQTGAIAGKGLSTVSATQLKLDWIANTVLGIGKNASVKKTTPITITVSANSLHGLLSEGNFLVKSSARVSGISNPVVEGSGGSISRSSVYVSHTSNESVQSSAGPISGTKLFAGGMDAPALEGAVYHDSDSAAYAEMDKLEGSAGISQSWIKTNAFVSPAKSVASLGLSHSRAKTPAYCELDTAWYPPVWIDGGLWIRQSHSVTQNKNGELVIL